MERITYSMLIQFFTLKEGVKQYQIAERLAENNGTISNIIKGERQLQQSITCRDFFDKIVRRELNIDKDGIARLYKFLKDQEALPKHIKDLFEDARSASSVQQKSACEAFFMGVLKEADQTREEGILGKKIGSKPKSVKEQEIRLAPFINSVVKDFIGRADLLHLIQDTLARHSIAVICGIGGLGKSQAALAYAKVQKEERGTYQHVQCVFLRKVLPIRSCASRLKA